MHNRDKVIFDKKLPYEYNICFYILEELYDKGVIDVFEMTKVIILLRKKYKTPVIRKEDNSDTSKYSSENDALKQHSLHPFKLKSKQFKCNTRCYDKTPLHQHMPLISRQLCCNKRCLRYSRMLKTSSQKTSSNTSQTTSLKNVIQAQGSPSSSSFDI